MDFTGHYEVDKNIKIPHKRSGDYYSIKTDQSLGEGCATQIELETFTHKNVEMNQIFFLETSGRSKLSPRQSCSVESAAKFSKLQVQVILFSNILDLTDNSTCYLYSSVTNVRFYTVDLHKIYKDTPLQHLVASQKFQKSKFHITHQSDALRLALIFKYGGFYSDLDAITIRDLSNFHNVIGATKINARHDTFAHLNNGVFHFEAKHQILLQTMKMFTRVFTGSRRGEVGPMLITKTVKEYFQLENIERLKTKTLEVTPIETFHPIKAFDAIQLWSIQPKSFAQWFTLFKNSSMVHFYASQTNKWFVERDPSHEAYAVLGPRYCPTSYWSAENF